MIVTNEEIPEALRTPDELLGHDHEAIRKMSRDGTSIAAARFMVRIDEWRTNRLQEAKPDTGLPPMAFEVDPYIRQVLREQAEAHQAQVARGSVEVAARLAELSALAQEEKQARIANDAESKCRDRRNLYFTVATLVVAVVGVIVSAL